MRRTLPSIPSRSLSGEIVDNVQGRPLAHWRDADCEVARELAAASERSHLEAWARASKAATQRSLRAYCEQYAQRQRDAFDQYFTGTLPPLWDEAGGYGYSPIHDVLQASMGVSSSNPHCGPIYSSFNSFYAADARLRLDARLVDVLRAARVHTLVSGHNPHGDGVVSLRFESAPDADVTAVANSDCDFDGDLVRVHCADNSYAANVKFGDAVTAAAQAAARAFAPNSPRALAAGADPRGRLSATAVVFDAAGHQHWLVGALSNGCAYANRIVTAARENDATDVASEQEQRVSALATAWIGRKLSVRLDDGLHTKCLLVKHVLDDGTLVAAETAGYNIINFRLRVLAPLDAVPSGDAVEVVPWADAAEAAAGSKL